MRHLLKVRIDQWLWAARFFKMRSLASEAAKGGHILINGVRCKASKIVQIHDEIQIRKENELFTVIVTGLAAKRGSASIAQTLYEETAASCQARASLSEQYKFQSRYAPSPNKKPSKHERKKIQQFKASGS